MSTIHTTLPKRLKSFAEADTGSESKGFVPPGTYAVVETKQNHPNADTDYAKLSVPGTGEVWICTRWKDSNYVEFQADPQPTPANDLLASAADILKPISDRISFDGKDDAIEESELISELKSYDGFTYHLKEPTYPYPLKGINVPQGPPHQNNCCTFVEGMLVKSWADNFPDFEWNNKRHGQMMIFSTEDYFSPVTAAVECGIAEAVDDVDAAPQPWTIIQGWKKQWSGGHTFFIVDHHPETDRVLTLESNMAFNLNGVGFRKIGMASDFDHKPPAKWWEMEQVWTWEKMKEVYAFRAMATVKVKNRSWSGVS